MRSEHGSVIAGAVPAMSAERGLVVALDDAAIVARARYLAGLVTAEALDRFVREPTHRCPDIYYRLKDHNGGADPTAPDPASRWTAPSGVAARTCDCSGGNSWMGGFDRYQPKRMAAAVGYDGWFNTDSKIIDATRTMGPRSGKRCFEVSPVPFVGAIIVCKSGSPGHKVGHEGRVIKVPVEWDARYIDCWSALTVVDVAGRKGRANMTTTGFGWARANSLFLRCVMEPDVG